MTPTSSRRRRTPLRALAGTVALVLAGTIGLAGPTLADTTSPPDTTPTDGATPAAVPLIPSPGTDEFDGTTLDGARWSVIRRDDTRMRVQDGGLTIDTAPGDLYANRNNAKNIVLQTAPTHGVWEIETEVTADVAVAFQQAGLILYNDDDNYAQLSLSGRNDNIGRLFFFAETGGNPVITAEDRIERPITDWPDTFHLKLASDGARITAHYSEDGEAWTAVGRSVPADTYQRVGLVSIGTDGKPVIPATFHHFRVATDGTPPPPPREGEGTVVPIDWDALGDEPLTGVDATSAEILANAGRHAMSTWWQSKFGSQAGAELLSFGGTGEHQIRPVAAEALALATALVTDTYEAGETGVGPDLARERTVLMIRSLAARHYSNTPGGWGGETSWQGALWAALASQAAWLLWDDLTEEDQRLVHVMVETEADRFVDYAVPYWKDSTGREVFPGDTKAEENSWNSMMLQVATAMIPDHPRWAEWSETNVELLVSSHARPSDVENAEVVNGTPVADWVQGWNVEEDGRAYNHDMLHPDYMATMVQQLYAATSATLAGQPTPEAAFHNMPLMFDHFVDRGYDAPPYEAPGGTIYREEGTIYYPEGTDWGSTRRLNFVAVDAVSAAFGVDQGASTDGRHWLEIHGRAALEMQARSTDGRTYQPSDDDNYNGREEWVAMHAAWSVLSLWAAQNGEVVVSDAAPADLLEPVEPPAPDEVVLALTPEAPDGANGWYVTPVTVTVEVVQPEGSDGIDDGGIAPLAVAPGQVEVSLDGETWAPYEAPLVIADDGVTTVSARLADGTGETVSTTVSLDATAPVVAIAGVGDDGAPTGDVTWSAEAVSGIAGYAVVLDGEPTDATRLTAADLTPGVHTLEVTATSTAGNVSETAVVELRVAGPDPTGTPDPTGEPTDGTTPPGTGGPGGPGSGGLPVTGAGVAALAALAAVALLGAGLVLRRRAGARG